MIVGPKSECLVPADMTRQFIPVEQAFVAWREDPGYGAAYDALEQEFALASALIAMHGDAGLTQEIHSAGG